MPSCDFTSVLTRKLPGALNSFSLFVVLRELCGIYSSAKMTSAAAFHIIRLAKIPRIAISSTRLNHCGFSPVATTGLGINEGLY